MSEIYKRHFYINKDIDQKVNEEIIEYDMKSAGLSIIKSGKLLDERMISLLEILPKDQRSIKIGNLQKKNKELTRALNEGFEYYRKVFLESNNVKDEDIISIKKDAIFTTKRCKNMEFDYVKFSDKNVYTSYYFFPGNTQIELYYNKNKLDVKGINNDKVKLHDKYMCDFFKRYAYMNEQSTKSNLIKFIKEFSYFYKTRNLDKNYYREFNVNSRFRLYEQITKMDVSVDNVDSIDVEEIDIVYNYFSFLVPIIERMI